MGHGVVGKKQLGLENKVWKEDGVVWRECGIMGKDKFEFDEENVYEIQRNTYRC